MIKNVLLKIVQAIVEIWPNEPKFASVLNGWWEIVRVELQFVDVGVGLIGENGGCPGVRLRSAAPCRCDRACHSGNFCQTFPISVQGSALRYFSKLPMN